MYKIYETKQTKLDLQNLLTYMIFRLKNVQAASNFLKAYDKQMNNLPIFPYAYRDIGYTYKGYAIRIKPFSTYNIFYVVDETTRQITILRILKNRQDWKDIMHFAGKYSF